jgi:glycosyltransferase involved in cell wall biosynthesis
LRLLAAGVPLVAVRTPTTTELLEGAAALVDPRATDDVVDAVLAFTRDGASRSIAVAAGRTRASDFSWSRRASEVTHLVRRAAARR